MKYCPSLARKGPHRCRWNCATLSRLSSPQDDNVVLPAHTYFIILIPSQTILPKVRTESNLTFIFIFTFQPRSKQRKDFAFSNLPPNTNLISKGRESSTRIILTTPLLLLIVFPSNTCYITFSRNCLVNSLYLFGYFLQAEFLMN